MAATKAGKLRVLLKELFTHLALAISHRYRVLIWAKTNKSPDDPFSGVILRVLVDGK